MSKAKIRFEGAILDRIEEIASTQGWTAEPTVLFTITYKGIYITSGPVGRGRPRKRFLITAPTLPDCFRALGEALEAIEARRG